MNTLIPLLSGALMICCWILSFLFLCFWRKTQDRLFLIFSVSFLLMGIERVILGLQGTDGEFNASTYLIRLSAFMLILVAVVDKNRSRA